MNVSREKNLEALVYSKDRSVVTCCCAAFADVPLDWVMFDNAELAKNYLAEEQFDFVLVDLDSAEGVSALEGVSGSHGIVLVISRKAIEPGILQMCYKSQFIYPVHPDEIESQLHRTWPLAERVASEHSGQEEMSLNSRQKELLHCIAIEHNPEARRTRTPAIFRQIKVSAKKVRESLGHFSPGQHSLSVSSQERVASAMAAIGSIWFVNEITRNFSRLAEVRRPSFGPTELIGLSLLLWFCAKQRRVSMQTVDRSTV